MTRKAEYDLSTGGQTMNAKRLIRIMSLTGTQVPQRQSRRGWVVAHCPLGHRHEHGEDRNPSFGVSLKRPHRVKCFSCNFRGTLTELLLECRKHPLPNANLREAFDLMDESVDDGPQVETDDWMPDLIAHRSAVEPWPEWYLDSFGPVWQAPHVMQYLHERNVTDDVIDKLDLRYDTHRHRVCFPVRDWTGRLCGLHGRLMPNVEHTLRYYAYGFRGVRNPDVWLGEHWIDPDRPVVVVESVFDLAAVMQHYDNVLCALYSGPSVRKIKRLRDCYELYWFFDNDKSGRDGQETAAGILGDNVHWFIQYPPNTEDKDPGELTNEHLKWCLDGMLNIDKWLAQV